MDDFNELRTIYRILIRGLIVTLMAAGAFLLYLVFSLFNMGPWL